MRTELYTLEVTEGDTKFTVSVRTYLDSTLKKRVSIVMATDSIQESIMLDILKKVQELIKS